MSSIVTSTENPPSAAGHIVLGEPADAVIEDPAESPAQEAALDAADAAALVEKEIG